MSTLPRPAALQGFLEAVTRHTVRGWARDPTRPDQRLRMQAMVQGRVIGTALADLFRGDVAAAGLGDGYCGFSIDLGEHASDLAGAQVAVVAASGGELQGSPAIAADPASLTRFLARWDTLSPALLARLGRMMRHRSAGGVSVIAMAPSKPTELVASLRGQLCDRWELIVPHRTNHPDDPRIRTLKAPRGAEAAIDAAIAAARHNLVLIVTGDVRFEADAIYHLLRAHAGPPAELFTWDLAQTRAGRATVDLLCRPAFSRDHFLSAPTLGGAFALPTATARALGWGAGEVDFILRLLERGGAVAHLPRVLHRTPDRHAADAAAQPAVQRHLDRQNTGAQARPADATGALVVDWPPATGRTLVVIPSHNQAALLRTCLQSLLRTRAAVPLDIVVVDHQSDAPDARQYLQSISGIVTVMPYAGPFNFARMNNLAVQRHGREAQTVLFLNNDTEATQPGWLERLRSLAIRADIGAVGALLLYDDQRVQHAGVVLGYDGSATHAHTLVHAYRADGTRNPGYGAQLTALREVSAVTAACMMMQRRVFDDAGGFDEALPIGFNDTDLCLRLRARGLRVLQDGQTILLHHESRTRRQFGQVLHAADTALFKARHADLIRAGDPFYNPNLRLDVKDHELRPDCLPGGPPRLTVACPPPPGAAPAAAAKTGSATPRRRRSSG